MTGRWLPLAVALLAGPAARAEVRAARDALRRGEYELALRESARVPVAQRAAASLLRARVLSETGRTEEALALATSLTRGSESYGAEVLVGELLARSGRHDAALGRWRHAARAPDAWRAHAHLAVWLARMGRADEAREAANVLLDAYNDAADPAAGGRAARLRDAGFLTSVALGAGALGAVRDANRALNEALAVAPDDPEVHVAQAELMRTTEDYAPAGEAVTAALRLNPRNPRALALRAQLRMLSRGDPARITEDLDAATAVDPSLPRIAALRAMSAMLAGDDTAAARALESASGDDPEVRAAAAALRFKRGELRGVREALDALHLRFPAWADGYQFIADVADVEHRYQEAAEVLREAALRPSLAGDRHGSARVLALLGFNLLRLGLEAEGLRALRDSFDRSRFNVRVANLLDFYEDTVATRYVTEERGPLRIRMHRDERPVLMHHAAPLLDAAFDDLSRRYGFTPEGPISIEMFASAEHFSLRTSGVPEVGVQGVCFGRVVTALSPRAGAFNWAQIVWHELAHVFAIQRSRSRVPRWFTEGLSEWEAARREPRWAREDDPSLSRALRQGRVPRIAAFNRAFTHARDPDDMMLAYYAASQLVTFMIERFGFERVISALPLWAQDLDTPTVIARALGVSADEVDERFLAWLRRRLARYERQFSVDPGEFRDRAARDALAAQRPDDGEALAAAAMAALVAGDEGAARALAERSVRVVGAQPLARWVRALSSLRSGDARAALDEVSAMREGGADGYEVRLIEARASARCGDSTREEQALRAAMAFDPSQVEAIRALATLRGRRGDQAEQAALLRAVVALDQHDREGLRALVALDLAASRWQELLALESHALQLDPEHAGGRLAVAHAAAELGQAGRAIAAFEDAARIEPRLAAEVRARISDVRAGRRGFAPLRAPVALE